MKHNLWLLLCLMTPYGENWNWNRLDNFAWNILFDLRFFNLRFWSVLLIYLILRFLSKAQVISFFHGADSELMFRDVKIIHIYVGFKLLVILLKHAFSAVRRHIDNHGASWDKNLTLHGTVWGTFSKGHHFRSI